MLRIWEIAIHEADFRIHEAVDIEIAIIDISSMNNGMSGSFIMHETGIITLLNPLRSLFKAFSISRFIAKGPHEDTWIVFVHLKISLIPVENHRQEVITKCNRVIIPLMRTPFLIENTMAFNISFGNDIEPHLRTHLVEPWS